jgi:hypothetical protein
VSSRLLRVRSLTKGSHKGGAAPYSGPITRQLLTSADSNADATSYTTASVTTAAGKLALLFIYAECAASPASPTVTSAGRTWVRVVDSNTDDPNIADNLGRCYCYRSCVAGATTETINIDFGATTQTVCNWALEEVSGTAATAGNNGSDAINWAQGVGNSTNATSATMRISKFVDATNNAVYHMYAAGADQGGANKWTPDTNFTEVVELRESTPGRGQAIQFKGGEDTTPTLTWSVSASNFGIALEIRASGTSAPAIVPVKLLKGVSDTDAASHATASYTPTANRLVLAVLGTDTFAGGAAPTSTAAGNGLTWVEVATVPFATISETNTRLTVFRAMGATPSAEALTFTHSGTVSSAAWSIIEFTGMDTSGTNGSGAIVQSATNRSDSATDLAVTLASFGSTNNATFYAGVIDDFGTANFPKPEAGLAEIYRHGADSGGGGPTATQFAMLTSFAHAPVTATGHLGSGAKAHGGIGIEIKAA